MAQKVTTRDAPNRRTTARQKRLARERFAKARKAEAGYARHLRHVAKSIGKLVDAEAPNGVVTDLGSLMATLKKYSEVLRPWARAVASRMIAEVDRRDYRSWAEHGDELGRGIREELADTDTGAMTRKLLEDQVKLITSLPLDEAQRVHKLTLEGLSDGTRAKRVAAEIMRSGEVTASRAMTIARTETSRTASDFTQARAQHIGSEGYIWRTAEDSDVRDDHKKLNGKFIRWSDPPIADSASGKRAHAGCIYNCRCYPEPVLPDPEDL